MARWVTQNVPHGPVRNASVFLGPFWTYPIDMVPTLLLFFNIGHSRRKIIFLGKSHIFWKNPKFSKIANFQFGSEWSEMELLMRSKVQNGSPRSTEAENKLFGAFPAEYPAEYHDMWIMHIMIHGRIFGRDHLKSAFFGFCGPRRPILHFRMH